MSPSLAGPGPLPFRRWLWVSASLATGMTLCCGLRGNRGRDPTLWPQCRLTLAQVLPEQLQTKDMEHVGLSWLPTRAFGHAPSPQKHPPHVPQRLDGGEPKSLLCCRELTNGGSLVDGDELTSGGQLAVRPHTHA